MATMVKTAKSSSLSTSESVEKEFQKVYQDLLVDSGDPETPSAEFQKLQELWRKSRESESRLAQRCRELQTQMAANKARALASAARSKEDQVVVASLKKEIEKAWKMVDDAHEKDQTSQDSIQTLQREMDHLNRIVEHGSSLRLTQERIADLLKIKEELTKNNESLQNDVTDLREALSAKEETVAKVQQENGDLQTNLTKALQDYQEVTVEIEREVRFRETVEIDYRRARAEAEVNSKSLEAAKKRIQELDSRTEILDSQLKEKQRTLEHVIKELENVKLQFQQSRQENETFQRQIKRLVNEVQFKMADMKVKADEAKKYYNDNVKLVKLRDSLNLRILKLGEQNAIQLQQVETLKNSIMILEKENIAAKKQLAEDDKRIDGLMRERNAVNKNLMKTIAACERHLEQLKVAEQTQHGQQQQMFTLKEDLEEQCKVASRLEMERTRLAKDNCDLRSKVARQADEAKTIDVSLFDCRKKLAENEERLRKLRMSYDTLMNERNSCERNLVEKQDEIADVRRKLKQMAHSVEQLKEDVADKENELFVEQQTSKKWAKDTEALRVEVRRGADQVNEAKSLLKVQDIQVTNLRKLINDIELEKAKKNQIIEKLINEKNHLTTTVLQKGDEVRSLTERLGRAESSLDGRQVEHWSAVEDVRLLKLEAKRLTMENRHLESSVAAIEELQNEIFRLEKDLMAERIKSKALEDELENPHNIHRWRRLAGSDPTTYDLIRKVHVLQKRLIGKCERQFDEVNVDVDSRRQAQREEKTDKEEEDDKDKAARFKCSSSAAANKLLIVQQQLREKEKLVKSLLSEQEVNLSRIDDYKREIDDVKRNLRDVKYQMLVCSRTSTATSRPPAGRHDERGLHGSDRHLSVPLASPSEPSPHRTTHRTRTLGSGFRMVSVLPD